ncbi:MAG: DNA topoisomerase 4 subunit A [Anaerolineaceae bacterium]|nr:DNA topoisomerase 4 subunit A [Anaerolineaceae bacterium]
MEIGLVKQVDIDQEMQQSYLDYAMSVIVSRALPDARDGMKPVQRRILYSMYDMGIRANSDYKKSARIVGDVLGKYHPHGDMAVYEAMARMAQEFSVRYPMVDGQGNFGSVDGDPPAAMRYTEARLKPFAIDILNQLDRDTVDFTRNFDDTLNEPAVLPAAIPNMLVNGASGIAVGMATNIPPHNLNEVIDAIFYMLDRWEKIDDISVDDLLEFVKGPDFPTGGIILQNDEVMEINGAYATGRGRIKVRGRVQIEEISRGRDRILISEIPYQTNKTTLIERIASLARDGKIEGISDLRDESDRQGMRIVIECTKNADTDNVLRALYQKTPLQSTFGINMLALVNGEPKLLSLKQAIKVYIEHRIEIIRRRAEYDLEKAKQRAHILEGLRIAISHLDEIIDIIRKSSDTDTARQRLMKKFKLSQIQANAILDMPLKRLSALERKKIEDEYKALMKTIKELQALLKSPKKMRALVKEELAEIQTVYGDRRRTQIVSLKAGESATEMLTASDLTPEEVVWIGLTEDGLIGRSLTNKLPRVSGNNAPIRLLKSTTHQTLFLGATDGRTMSIAVEALPTVDSFQTGVHFSSVSGFTDRDDITCMASIKQSKLPEEPFYICSVTRKGMIKKSDISELPGPASAPFQLMKIASDDEMGWIFFTNGTDEINMVTTDGMGIKFSEDDVRSMGLVAGGVNGIKLKSEVDIIVGAGIVNEGEYVICAANDGQLWKIPTDDLVLQGRYGQGTIMVRLSNDAKLIGSCMLSDSESFLAHFHRLASKQLQAKAFSQNSRARITKQSIPVTKGDSLIELTQYDDYEKYWHKALAPKKGKAKKKKSAQSTLPGIE